MAEYGKISTPSTIAGKRSKGICTIFLPGDPLAAPGPNLKTQSQTFPKFVCPRDYFLLKWHSQNPIKILIQYFIDTGDFNFMITMLKIIFVCLS